MHSIEIEIDICFLHFSTSQVREWNLWPMYSVNTLHGICIMISTKKAHTHMLMNRMWWIHWIKYMNIWFTITKHLVVTTYRITYTIGKQVSSGHAPAIASWSMSDQWWLMAHHTDFPYPCASLSRFTSRGPTFYIWLHSVDPQIMAVQMMYCWCLTSY